MTTMTTPQSPPSTRLVTLAEFAALPKHPRYELVKGKLVEQMSASREHEKAVVLVSHYIVGHVLANRLGEVYGSNRAFVTGPDSPATSRLPDVSFVSNARLNQPELHGMLYDGAPDLAIEVVSPGNSAAEIARKVAEYLAAGSKAVWVIDLARRMLTVHLPDAAPQTLTERDSVDGGDYLPGFACAVADLLPD